ncbi:hypothetical protein K466DRAFT_585772 [Polyporus arcularius HHB13444]|uniref:Uncharacterized protein n=1 Tax=Polyporus arcularius HHB13444 TaxID=1314778 RepID=A0A5C3PQ43_9APHY|nr:hypothetical protein K466DRAFT_585772 [Polyporus arcularius HHB13444]
MPARAVPAGRSLSVYYPRHVDTVNLPSAVNLSDHALVFPGKHPSSSFGKPV